MKTSEVASKEVIFNALLTQKVLSIPKIFIIKIDRPVSNFFKIFSLSKYLRYVWKSSLSSSDMIEFITHYKSALQTCILLYSTGSSHFYFYPGKK